MTCPPYRDGEKGKSNQASSIVSAVSSPHQFKRRTNIKSGLQHIMEGIATNSCHQEIEKGQIRAAVEHGRDHIEFISPGD